MNRIDRLQAILISLQSKRIIKAEELAKKFEVSIRTIYRDIRALEEGGVPIGAEAGIGYYLIDGYHLPPIMFTNKEAKALLIGGNLLEKQTDAEVSRSFNDALTKVRAVLDLEKKDDLEDLEKHILVNPFSAQNETVINDPNIQVIESALTSRRLLHFEYFANYKGEFSSRSAEAIGLCYYGNQWHLIAYCLLRKDYRDFRLDRISKIKILPDRYQRHVHPSLQEYVDKLIEDTELTTVEIKMKITASRHIQDVKFQMGLIEENKEGEWVRLRFATPSITYFARWLMMFGNSVQILSPEILKEKATELAIEISGHHLAE